MGPRYDIFMEDYAKANMFARKIYNYFYFEPDIAGMNPSYSIPEKKDWMHNNVPMTVIVEGVYYYIWRKEQSDKT